MNRIVQVVGLVVLVIVLAWGAMQIGGIGIRRVKPLGEQIVLSASQPVVPGVDVVVRWNVPTVEEHRMVEFLVRSETTTVFAGSADIASGSAAVRFSCEDGGQTVGLLMNDAESHEVLANTELPLLPAGPDCVE